MIREIFDKFQDQNWDENSKLTLLMNWLDQTDSSDRTNISLKSYLQKIADEENGCTAKEEPTVNFTAGFINRNGAWLKFCEFSGMGYWAMAEGQCDSSEKFEIPISLAKEWGLLK